MKGNSNHWTRSVLSLALFSTLCASCGSQKAVSDNAASRTSAITTAAQVPQPDTLERAWEEAIALALRLKRERGRVTGSATDGGHLSGDNSPPGTSTLPGLPPVSVAMDQPLWAGKVTAVLPLFANDPSGNGLAAGKAARKSAKFEECRETLDLKLSVAAAYVNVLRARRAAQRAAENLARLASGAQTVSNLYQTGHVPSDDLPASQTALNDGRQRESRAREALEAADTAYNQLLGRPLTNAVTLQDLMPPPAGGDVNELTALALQERPELMALAEQSEALRQEAKAARPSAVPSVGVSGGYSHLDTVFLQRDYIWSLGLVGTWNIFDEGFTRRQARLMDDKADAISALKAKAMQQVSSEVREATLGVSETRRRVEIASEEVAEAERNLAVARDLYRTGTGTNSQVLEAEALRLGALGNHDRALYDAVMAVFALRHAVGNL